jgi:hypothetical protein
MNKIWWSIHKKSIFNRQTAERVPVLSWRVKTRKNTIISTTTTFLHTPTKQNDSKTGKKRHFALRLRYKQWHQTYQPRAKLQLVHLDLLRHLDSASDLGDATLLVVSRPLYSELTAFLENIYVISLVHGCHLQQVEFNMHAGSRGSLCYVPYRGCEWEVRHIRQMFDHGQVDCKK